MRVLTTASIGRHDRQVDLAAVYWVREDACASVRCQIGGGIHARSVQVRHPWEPPDTKAGRQMIFEIQSRHERIMRGLISMQCGSCVGDSPPAWRSQRARIKGYL